MKQLIKDLNDVTAVVDLNFDRETKEFENVYGSPTVIERDGLVIVSAEDGKGFADYYGEFTGGDMWINPELEAIAKKHGGYWEWESAGAISFAEE